MGVLWGLRWFFRISLTKTAKVGPLHAAFAVCNLQSDRRALQLSSGAQAAICICNLQAADAPALQRTEPTRPLSRRLRQFVKFLLRGHLLRPVLKPIAQAVRRRELSSNVQLHAADIELCCREKACGSHDHAIDEDKRLPVRNDRAQPHSAHALRVSAFAKGATQRVDPATVVGPEMVTRTHCCAYESQPKPGLPCDLRACASCQPRRSHVTLCAATTPDGRGTVNILTTRDARLQMRAARQILQACSLQLAECRLQERHPAQSAGYWILEGRGGLGGGGRGACAFVCRFQIADCHACRAAGPGPVCRSQIANADCSKRESGGLQGWGHGWRASLQISYCSGRPCWYLQSQICRFTPVLL